MGIRESLLNTITSVSDSDFVRLVTSAGTSSKATVQNLFKSFESDLNAKSSLTTSDYIRVVGSDNVSYKQQVSSVMGAFKVSRTSVANSTDFDSLGFDATLGSAYYRGANISTMTNRPSAETNAYPWALDVINIDGYVKQILHVYSAAGTIKVYERQQHYSSGSQPFASWEAMPTRAEVDALTTSSAVTVTALSNVVIDINTSRKIGRTLFLNVKGHTTADIANVDIFTFSGTFANPANFTFGIPTGSTAWSIGEIAYGFIRPNAVTATISSGRYFHICQAFLCDM